MNHLELTNAEYHARPELSRSQVMDFIESPELFYGRHVAKTIPPVEPKNYFDFGTLVDVGITEGRVERDKLPEDVVVIPEELLDDAGGKRKKVCQNWIAEQPDGVRCWGRKEVEEYRSGFDKFDLILKQIGKHEKARELVWHPDRIPQPSFVFERDGVALRTRPDLLLPDYIVDIKTAESISERAIRKSIYNYGYDVQGVMCSLGDAANGGHPKPFVLVVIHSKAPYEIVVYELDDDWMEIGYDRFSRAIKAIARARENGNGEDQYRSPTHGEIVPISPPTYLLREFAL